MVRKKAEPALEPAAAEPLLDKGGPVRVRVLFGYTIAGKWRRPNEVVDVEPVEFETLLAIGVVDSDPAAVAHALSVREV